MADEFVHESAGQQLTSVEDDGIDRHKFNNQAKGDMMIASSATQLSRRGIGSAGRALIVRDGVPIWTSDLVVDTAGIITAVKQVVCRVYLSGGDVTVPTGTDVRVPFNLESFDITNNFDGARLTGTDDRANGEGADHLIDNGNDQFSSADVGKWVWNTTDNTYTTVKSFIDSGDLELNDAIFTNGEGYILYNSAFTVPVDGRYLIAAQVSAGTNDGKFILASLVKNATVLSSTYAYCSVANGYPVAILSGIYNLSASDIITVALSHNAGVDKVIYDLTHNTFLSIVKVT